MTPSDFRAVLAVLPPGRTYYIPQRVVRSHQLWGRLESRVHHQMCAEMGGTTLYVPSQPRIERQRLAIHLAEQGRTVTEIADRIGVTPRTVNSYLANIR